MKLVDEAIDILSDANQPLANAFFKAQVIAHKLQNRDFAKWVKDEIQGYGDDDELPKYRISNLTPYGNVENGVKRYTNYKLPIGGMPEDMVERVLVVRHSQSIAVIEEFSKKADDLIVSIDHRFFPFLRQGIEKSFGISSAWGKPPAGCFEQILNEARSRLLDFLLNLEHVLPETEAGAEPKVMPKVEGLSEMFKGAVFGDGANISLAIGEGNQASHNKSTVGTKDLPSLIRELRRNKVAEADVAELQVAIKDDDLDPESDSKNFGPGVRAWLAGMISKAGTPAWEIPAQVGAGVLTSALTKFFGM
ncbi:hypothetical protein JTY93_10910 [Pseudomonas hygromyciniae]|uniref:AbiTii domain-containing protein n=1 Tax=Pseudomonas hygromyciniae TaxID=2812000 RepID=A0ABX7K2E0_9PSED|nr:hypothetical protein [Pseudomonas hygromyciniae]MBN0978864.1 hypothetical protein [Pseudomonas hygromyciniae]QSB41806.1 hypothetical protein JTY93_10910 [Pseudomonas hygromyciniae]